MLSLTVNGTNVAELKKNMAIALRSMSAETETTPVETEEETEAAPPVKRGRGRPPKAAGAVARAPKAAKAKSAVSDTDVLDESADEESETEATDDAADDLLGDEPAKATFDDAKAALKTLSETKGKGVAAARLILEKMGVQRLSELPEGKYAAFIAACKKA